MSLITVYAYRFFSEEQNAFIRADPYATLDLIKLKQWEPIIADALQVDSSEIFDGRYHPALDIKL